MHAVIHNGMTLLTALFIKLFLHNVKKLMCRFNLVTLFSSKIKR